VENISIYMVCYGGIFSVYYTVGQDDIMKPDISEFSYGYALTDELIHWHGTNITASPVFPSLYQEGQTGGGYDVMLQRPGIPLFLQFKLSNYMVRNSAYEVKIGHFTKPFYRFHIRPSRHSAQHEMLLDLEADGNEVYYSAPAFHTPEGLNDAYLNHQVRSQSLWLKPSVIGQLPDPHDHHVAFQLPGNHRFYSEPRELKTRGDFEEFTKNIITSYEQRGHTALNHENLMRLRDTMKRISTKRLDISKEAKQRSDLELEKRHLLASISFYAHVFFDSQFFLVRRKYGNNVQPFDPPDPRSAGR
jgi:hypothetical protein